MMNTMEIEGYRAVIRYDPEIEMFRGEFLGLNGGADFYACDIEGLHKEGSLSLKVFLEMCDERRGGTQESALREVQRAGSSEAARNNRQCCRC